MPDGLPVGSIHVGEREVREERCLSQDHPQCPLPRPSTPAPGSEQILAAIHATSGQHGTPSLQACDHAVNAPELRPRRACRAGVVAAQGAQPFVAGVLDDGEGDVDVEVVQRVQHGVRCVAALAHRSFLDGDAHRGEVQVQVLAEFLFRLLFGGPRPLLGVEYVTLDSGQQ